MCSVGPILAVIALGIFADGDLTYQLPDYSMDSHLGKNFLPALLSVAKEVIVAIGLIAIFFFILQVIFLKLPKKKLFQILIGIAYTVVGLVVFLTAVSVGFMPIGYKMGTELASGPSWMIVVFGFILGTVVVLAEPAVHVLNKQVEEITGGTVSKTSMMIAFLILIYFTISFPGILFHSDFHSLFPDFIRLSPSTPAALQADRLHQALYFHLR